VNARFLGAVAVAAAILACAPVVLSGYYLNVCYMTLLYVGLAYGWNIISGYAGYFSFGQVAFFGIGAYVMGLLVLQAHWNWFPATVVGGIAGLIVAIPAGYLMLRLRGPFFSLGMFGLAQTAKVLFSASDKTGGGTGLYLPPGSDLKPVYWWTLAVAVGAFLMTAWLNRSAFGLRLRALREDEQVAGTLGVDVTRAKIVAFGISALIAALLGGAYAWFLTTVDPEAVFSSRLDLQAIVMAIFGGIGTLWGPLVGAIFMTQVSEALWARFPQAYLMIFGGLLVALLIFMPRGLVPALTSRFRKRNTGGMVPVSVATPSSPAQAQHSQIAGPVA
jgi:branched-chain amino acid transport system permease protein